MRFFADEMLGKLARWLRALGVDVAYEGQCDDDKIVARVKKEGRVILTRDKIFFKRLQAMKFSAFFVHHDLWTEQIKEVFSEYPTLRTLKNLFTRCMECNEILEKIEKEKVKDRVWPFVYETQDQFSYCKKCDRIYWQATHVEKMKERLRVIIEESSL
jgi:uncharacterized protein with PIN domain